MVVSPPAYHLGMRTLQVFPDRHGTSEVEGRFLHRQRRLRKVARIKGEKHLGVDAQFLVQTEAAQSPERLKYP
jgi:hypothetical protein